MTDKRIRPRDRRDNFEKSDVPLVDSNGKTIKYNRRVRPDRRLNDIVVEEIEWEDDGEESA